VQYFIIESNIERENSGNLTALETEVITLMSEMFYDQSGPATTYVEAKKKLVDCTEQGGQSYT